MRQKTENPLRQKTENPLEQKLEKLLKQKTENPLEQKLETSLKQKPENPIVKTSETSYNKDKQRKEALKSLENLTLADRFIFFKVMQDADLCKHLLEIILGVEIERIEYPEGEKTIEVFREAKGIRLDIYVKDGRSTV